MDIKVTLQDLVDKISDKSGSTKKSSDTFLHTLIDLIEEGLLNDGISKIKGLGTFKVITIEERKSVNVQDGSEFIIPEHQKISFTPDKEMKEEINKPYAHLEIYPLSQDGPIDQEAIENEDEDADSLDDESFSNKNIINEPISSVITSSIINEPTNINEEDDDEPIIESKENALSVKSNIDEPELISTVENIKEDTVSEPTIDTTNIELENSINNNDEKEFVAEEKVEEKIEDSTNETEVENNISSPTEEINDSNLSVEKTEPVKISPIYDKSLYQQDNSEEASIGNAGVKFSGNEAILPDDNTTTSETIDSNGTDNNSIEDKKEEDTSSAQGETEANENIGSVDNSSTEEEPKEKKKKNKFWIILPIILLFLLLGGFLLLKFSESIPIPEVKNIVNEVKTELPDIFTNENAGNKGNATTSETDKKGEQNANNSNANKDSNVSSEDSENNNINESEETSEDNTFAQSNEFNEGQNAGNDNSNENDELNDATQPEQAGNDEPQQTATPKQATPSKQDATSKQDANEGNSNNSSQPEIINRVVKNVTHQEKFDPSIVDFLEKKYPYLDLAVTGDPLEITISDGQRLTLLALKYYGHKSYWVYLYFYNNDVIKNPNNVPAGTKILIPQLNSTVTNVNSQVSIDAANDAARTLLNHK